MNRTATETGRLGEYLTAYILEREGIACSVVDRRGTDMWCERPDGSHFRLEVKTAEAPCHRGKGAFSYSFQVRRREADWYAFVALDLEKLLIRPRSWLRPYTTHRLSTLVFEEERGFPPGFMHLPESLVA